MDQKKVFQCPFQKCTNSYSTKYSLQRHCSIRHKKSKRFNCKVCKKVLSSNQNLNEHLLTHTKEKPLKCPYPDCTKYFRQSSQLSYHKNIHLYALRKSKTFRSLTYPKVISI